jgi:hypothetical protein
MTLWHEEMMNTMIKNDEKYEEAQLANEAKYQAAQLANNAKHKEAQAAQLKSDEKFERLMQKLTTKIMEDAPCTRRQKSRRHNYQDPSASPTVAHHDNAMDTEHNNNSTTDPVQRPMDTEAPTPMTPSTQASTKQQTNLSAHHPTECAASAHTDHTTPKESEAAESSCSSSNSRSPSSGSSSGSSSHQSRSPPRERRTRHGRGGRGHGGHGRGHGSNQRMITQTPASLAKSPWKDNQNNVDYDDQAVETFEGGKGANEEHEWQDPPVPDDGSIATVINGSPHSVKTIPSDTSSHMSAATPEPSPISQPLPWSPDPRAETPDED